MAISLADALRQTGYSQDGELAVPASVEPTMTSILQKHIASLPQQLATNQAALDSAIGSWNKTDFGTGKPNANYRPEAIQELTQLMPNVGALTAWHGTPHQIKGAFDLAKVGTGEGNQAYGHGMYFAENPNVAKEYQKMLAGPEQTAAEHLKMYKTPEKAISALESGITPNLTPEAKKFSQDAIDVLKSGKDLKGNLYKVNIPDEHIPNMLDWDKPLSKQSPQVQEALAKVNPKFYDPKSPNYDPNESGQWIYMSVAGNITPEAQQSASAKLNEFGVKGVRYLDEGSRGAGKGTSNFVVFDPSTVKTLEENGMPLTRKELIEQQLNKVVE